MHMSKGKSKAVVTIADPFLATGADLRSAAEQGNEAAIAELARRAEKRASKRAATPAE